MTTAKCCKAGRAFGASRSTQVFLGMAGSHALLPVCIYVLALSFLDDRHRSFQDSTTHAFTLQNFVHLLQNPNLVNAYWISIKISLITSMGGGIFGFLLAYSAIRGGLPRFMRSSLMTFCGVASNFAGVPLAFAFIALLSPAGVLTGWLRAMGYNPYFHGFQLYTFWGLSIVYMYFQFPLMVLVIAPAIDGLRREWLEAAENLGASTFQYWRYVALPILLPSILGTMILLFGNSFGAFATAQALTGGSDQSGDHRDWSPVARRCIG